MNGVISRCQGTTTLNRALDWRRGAGLGRRCVFNEVVELPPSPASLSDENNRPTLRMVPRHKKEKGGDTRISKHTPWIFRNEVENFEELRNQGKQQSSLMVNVINSEGRELGVAACSLRKGVNIVARMLTDNITKKVDENLFADRIKRAMGHRLSFFTKTSCYRLLNGEGDLVPGVVCDRYEDHLCVQFPSAAMEELAQETIFNALEKTIEPRSIIRRCDLLKDRELEHAPPSVPAVVRGAHSGLVVCQDGDMKLSVDLLGDEIYSGRIFEDRPLRRLLGDMISRQSTTGGEGPGIEFLSIFGESIGAYCASRGANVTFALPETATSAKSFIDRLCSINACAERIKHFAVPENMQGTDPRFMVKASPSKEGFDVVTLEPPDLAATYGQVEEGERKYTALVNAAVHAVKPGGSLLVVCRSRPISTVRLMRCINMGVWAAGRQAQVLHRTVAAPADFPVHMSLLDSCRMQSVLLRVP